ncbi:MAG: uroporphyrinogen decarboxylase family protein [Rubripirellula sp.]|nr:uroporphyrinogen decarboxylase family protein [Rubripirellula sp.]
MLDLYDDSAFVHDLLAFTVELGLRYGKAQIDAGADIIGIGDAAASLIGPKSYEKYVWPYERKLVDGLQAMGATVRLHICGNTKSIVDGMGRLGCEIVDLDYFTPVDSARVAGIQLLCIQPTCI